MTASSASRARTLLGAAAVSVIAFALAFSHVERPGIAWDEPFYIGAAVHYAQWVLDLSPSALGADAINTYWRWGSEHPPLAKMLVAATGTLFGGLGSLTAFRIASCLCFCALAGLVFYFMARHFGQMAGLFSALFLVLMPRLFGHALLVELDIPLALFWFLGSVAFLRGHANVKWSAIAGVCYGLAVLTKFTGVLLILPCALWALAFRPKGALRTLAIMCLVAPVVFLIGWPWLWHDTLEHLRSYADKNIRRMVIPTYYLGKAFYESYPPWHYVPVMIVATTPLASLVMALPGAARTLRRWRRERIAPFLLLSPAGLAAVAMLPTAPRYDGIRLLLPLLPFIACMAGLGLKHVWEVLRERAPKAMGWARAAIVGIFFAQLLSLLLIAPFGLSYYSWLLGGLSGAERLGFEPTYWGEPLDESVMRFLNDKCEKDARIAFFPVGEQVMDVWAHRYPLRADLSVAQYYGYQFDYLVLLSRKGMWDDLAWAVARKLEPIYAVRRGGLRRDRGTVLCAVYRMPAPPSQISIPATRGTSEASDPALTTPAGLPRRSGPSS